MPKVPKCRNNFNGKCIFGNNCPFFHCENKDTTTMCHYEFRQLGSCKDGDRCPYVHPQDDKKWRKRQREQEKRQSHVNALNISVIRLRKKLKYAEEAAGDAQDDANSAFQKLREQNRGLEECTKIISQMVDFKSLS